MIDDSFYVDLMTSIPGLDPNNYDEQYRRRQINLVEGVEIPYIHLGDLLLNKRATARPKDLDDYSNLKGLED